uniref:Uncharacterized protein n=1 Tax=Zea mays TaxID=4577 RepID=A0A804NWI2_MAIZE
MAVEDADVAVTVQLDLGFMVFNRAVGLGYKSVAHFLIAKHNNKQLPTDIVNNAEELQ